MEVVKHVEVKYCPESSSASFSFNIYPVPLCFLYKPHSSTPVNFKENLIHLHTIFLIFSGNSFLIDKSVICWCSE